MAKYIFIFLGMVGIAAGQPATLTPLGPNGGIISMLKGSLNDEVILAVIEENHLLRTTDGGESWNMIALPTSSLQNYSLTIFEIAINPNSPDSILIATTAGVYRSADKGTTWSLLSTFPTPRFSVRFAPGNPSVLIGADENGVLRSTNGGTSWIPLKDNNYFGNRMVRRVAIHPADNNPAAMRIVATTGFDDTTGIFLTTDGGTSWKPMVEGLPPGNARKIYTAEVDSTGLGSTDFRVVVGTGEGIYAMQTDYLSGAWQAVKSNSFPMRGVITGGTLVYESYDSVAQQHKFNFFVSSNGSAYDGTPAPYTTMNGIFKIESRFSTIIAQGGIQPPITRVFDNLCDITAVFVPQLSNKEKLYVGTSDGIFISLDGGLTWQRKNTGFRHSVVRNLVSFYPNLIVNRNLFAGVFGGGVIRSNDDGVSWSSANTGLTNPYVTAVAVDYVRNILYAGSVLTVYRSTDAGKSWNTIFAVDSSKIINPSRYRTRDNDMTIRISTIDPDKIMFRSPAYGLNISTNGGAQWSLIQQPPGFDSIHVPENIAFDPIEPSTIYLTGRGIYKSTDLGNSWIDISSTIPSAVFDPSYGDNVSLETISPTINPSKNGEIFLTTVYSRMNGKPYRLFKTTDGGLSWNGLDTAVKVYDVEYDRYDQQRIVAAGPGGIFQSVNGGSTWSSLTPAAVLPEFYLINSSAEHANTYYVGSDNGAVKVELTDHPSLTVDTLEHDFGNIQIGQDSTRTIFFRNTNGQRNVLVRFNGLSDTASFRYLGKPQYDIPAGGEVSFDVRFVPNTGGVHGAIMRFTSTDEKRDSLRFVVKGRSFSRSFLETFSYDFGSVTVGKDTVLQIDLDNQYGTTPITVNFLGGTDTATFSYQPAASVVVDTGVVFPMRIKFTPRTAGVKKSLFAFTTTDPKFPAFQFRLNGTGVIKNFVTRRVLIDTGVGFVSYDGQPVHYYYKSLIRILTRAGIEVEYVHAGTSSRYHSMMYVLPNGRPPQEVIDSLQRYILNGGTVVGVGDFGHRNDQPFNVLLHDSTWQKFGVRTGIRFNADLIYNEPSTHNAAESGAVAAYPVVRNTLTNNVDSLILLASGSLSIDTTVTNVAPLFAARSPFLVSANPDDSSVTPIPYAYVAAMTRIGKGKIVAIADYDIWWNGTSDDSTDRYGLFSGRNLQFALNVFGAVDNYTAKLPNPTPQEAYTLISIPYSFTDSSVIALFKDLGPPNNLIWRMFGRWSDTKGYGEFPKDFRIIRRGEGYWLITKQPMTIDFGTTDLQGSEDDFEIVLHPGYNMIGNPFPYKVSWANSYREDSTVSRHLWFYNKGFDTTTQLMEPFRGYFVKNNSGVTKKIRINAAPVEEAAVLAKEHGEGNPLSQGEWKIQLIADNGTATDQLNFIGMLNASTDGRDAEDLDEPPSSPGNYISLTFNNKEDKLAADYRSVSSEGSYWDFDVASNQFHRPVVLTADDVGALPSNFAVFVLDTKTERVYDITASQTYSFQFEKNESKRSLRILVGTRIFVESNTNGIPLVPLEYVLYQNYPNPFNPRTAIHYTLAHSGIVKLDVFNVLGQKIKTIVQEFQPIGGYTVYWDGKNDANSPVASGVYYYRLQSRSFTSIKKMTLIK